MDNLLSKIENGESNEKSEKITLDFSKDTGMIKQKNKPAKVFTFREKIRVINWMVILCGTVIFCVPLYVNGIANANGIPVGNYAYLQQLLPNATTFDNALIKKVEDKYVGDDGIWLIYNLQYNVMSAINLGIAIPSIMDLCVDIFNESPFTPFPPVVEDTKNNIVRLSLLERSVFLFGVICNGFYMFFPWTTMNIMISNNVNNVFNNLCVILQQGPILLFLERSTETFHPLTALFLNICLCVGVDIYAISLLYPGTYFIKVLYYPCFTLYSIFTWGTVGSCLMCFGKYLRNKGVIKLPGDENLIIEDMDAYADFNANQVPALHMIGLNVEILVCFVWYYLLSNMSNSVNVLLNMLYIFAASLVMVIEMRVRANEVQQGLVSCRLFVRKTDQSSSQAKLVSDFVVEKKSEILVNSGRIINSFRKNKDKPVEQYILPEIEVS